MKKETYFKRALASGAYRYRNWIISIFSQILDNPYPKDYPFKLVPKDGQLWFVTEEGGLELIEDFAGGSALVKAHDPISLRSGEIINYKGEEITTTYGTLFANYFVVVYPFKDKIPYINKHFTGVYIESLILDKFSDNPKEGEAEDPSKIYVYEREKLAEATNELIYINDILVTNASRHSLTGSPNNKAIRDKLVKEHKGDINDPLLGAKIDKAIGDEERRYIAEDPEGTKHFYTKAKSYNNARKRMGGAFGYEAPFTSEQKGKLILSSLQEGIEIEDLPHLINGARAGSDFRANDTQIGGSRSKDAFRSFQNDRIEGEDCGTKLGFKRRVIPSDKKILVGSFFIGDDNKPTEITEDNFKSLVDKIIILRVPGRCNAPPSRTCRVCAGVHLSKNERSPSIATGKVGTGFLKGSLKKMHVSAAELVRYDINLLIS